MNHNKEASPLKEISANSDRPLSPHLSVYRWEWTMFYSILHRMTGVALSAGALYMVLWLASIAIGQECFEHIQSFNASILGKLMLFGWTWALIFHLCNGIRHMVWDTGHWFSLESARASGHAGMAISILSTIIIWVIGYSYL